MVKTHLKIGVSIILLAVGLLVIAVPTAGADALAQEATQTATPEGHLAQVNNGNEGINVRSGPGTDYEKVGELEARQIVTVYGKSAGGTWLQIHFSDVPGERVWVYTPLMTIITTGELPIIEPPSTPTPLVTVTIDLTLAAQFITEPPPTRLPTFTPPQPLVVPTLPPAQNPPLAAGFPWGIVILSIVVIGILGVFISSLLRR